MSNYNALSSNGVEDKNTEISVQKYDLKISKFINPKILSLEL